MIRSTRNSFNREAATNLREHPRVRGGGEAQEGEQGADVLGLVHEGSSCEAPAVARRECQARLPQPKESRSKGGEMGAGWDGMGRDRMGWGGMGRRRMGKDMEGEGEREGTSFFCLRPFLRFTACR